jgi:ABC-type glycerol-3-phosphate transport system substrate-binding protein
MGAAWDWDAFLDYAKRLNPGTGQKYGVDASSGIETGWYNWAVANGGRIWSDDYKTCTVNKPEVVEAVEQYFGVANKLQASPPRDWLNEQTKPLPHAAYRLANGIVAMQTAGDWFFGWYDRAASLRWDVAPMPYAPRSKKTGSIANFRGLGVAPTAQNRDLAWAWIAFLIRREVQDRVPALMGEVPARMDSIDQVYLNPAKAPTPKSRRVLKAAIDATYPMPAHPLVPWGDVNGTANALQDVYDGKRQVKEALAEIQEKLTAMIRR